MRTSNKILLSFFLAVVIVMTAIPAALYVKYKNGEIILTKVYKSTFIRHDIKQINYISIIGFSNVNIIPSDIARVETENDTAHHLQVNIIHDTLVITDTSFHRKELEAMVYSSLVVNVYLSGIKNIHAAYCNISLEGSPDSSKAISYMLNLTDNSELAVGNDQDETEAKENRATNYIKTLHIQAKSTPQIDLHSSAVINELDLLLIESSIWDKGVGIGRIKIDADSNSEISLRGVNLKKLNRPQKQ